MQASAQQRTGSLGDRHLARRVLRERDALRRRILLRTAPLEQQTVVLDVLAESLIDRFSEALADASWTPLLSWADEICRERPQANGIRRLFTSVVPALGELFADADFSDVGTQLGKVANKPRVAEPGFRSEAVDELDVLLADMVGRIEFADTKTAEHCRAVSAWCARIANRMSLTRAESTFVARGGLIHDVGKSKSPLEILQAPRSLTQEETAVMREHVLAGHEIIKAHPKLTDFSGMVRSHHERFDGGGYPDRLDRTRIPVSVRIVSVADSFNAMIGRRPYRTPFSPNRAAVELQHHAGSQFDPDVVRALLDVISAKDNGLSATERS